jgi:hypothetical protein
MTDRDRALIVALADGTLDGRRLARAQALVARLPDGPRQLERQRRAARALSAGPPVLDGSGIVAGDEAAPGEERRPMLARRRTGRGRLVAPGLAAATLAALVALVVTVALPGGTAPSVAAVARLGMLAPVAPAPASAGTTLHAEQAGLPFPDWGRRFGWHAAGTRTDRIADRDTRTVFYAHMGHLIGYTIVDGPPLDVPDGARRVRRDGTTIALYRDRDGRDVAVFERGGHTCVLAGHVLHRDTLVKLAAWRPA